MGRLLDTSLKMLRRRYRTILNRALAGLLIAAVVTVAFLFFITIRLSGGLTGDAIIQPQKEDGIESEKQTLKASFDDEPLSLKGYTKVDISILPGKMVVAKNCTGIVMTTTTQKTYSIEKGVDKKVEIRPDEHDLITDILDFYSIKPVDARISNFSNDVYYAEILLKENNKVLSLDAKPSDALAIAARLNMPVYMRTELLNKYGSDVCKK